MPTTSQPPANLQHLCEGFCEIAQVAAPELQAQADGIAAFTIHWRDVDVQVIARPAADPDHAFALFDLGTPEPARADLSRVLMALMHNNFMALRASQPVFSVQPESDRVMLQWPVPLRHVTPALLHQMIEEGVELALQWRRDYFLTSTPPDAAGTVAAPVGDFA